MHLLLMGLRGSGKSTFGRKLAHRLQRPFIDLDDLTPSEMNEVSVADAFARQGEPAFRAAEVRALSRVLGPPTQPPLDGAGKQAGDAGTRAAGSLIIALGGGTPTAPGFDELLAPHRASGAARLIYLRASAGALRAHLQHARNAHRPSLTGQSPLAEIGEVLLRRDPLYLRLADAVIETDERARGEILDQLARLA